MEPLLKAENLSVAYGEKEAVHSVTFRLFPGKVLVIAGESGSGKSTVLKAVQGLLGRGGRLLGGRICFEGRDITRLSPGERRKLAGEGMAAIFQNPGASFCPIRTVGDQIYEAVRAHRNWSREEFRERAWKLMESIHLKEEVLEEYPFRLSGGMGQRVGILAAMILSPRLILADEPTSALDAVTRADVVRELMGLRRETGVSLLLVTHDMEVARSMADEVMVLRKGRMVEYGTKEAVFLSPGEPYTRELMEAVPRLFGPAGQGEDGLWKPFWKRET